MILGAEQERALTSVVSEGVALSAARLADITHDAWRVIDVAMSRDGAGSFAAGHASVSGDHYGSHVTFPGGSFLVQFSGKSGYLVTSAFTRDFQDRTENMEKRESASLGEAANILLNPLIGHLAKSWGVRLIISGPQTRIGSPREHLERALERYREGNPLAAAFRAHLDSPQLFSECLLMLFLERSLVERAVGAPPA